MGGITADQSSTFLPVPLFKPGKSLVTGEKKVIIFPVERLGAYDQGSVLRCGVGKTDLMVF